MAKILDAQARKKSLARLAGWTYDAKAKSLRKTFKFKDFSAAFAFMTRCAMAAEKMDHHPDWRNVYNTLDVALSTHDAGGVTANDMDLARTMNALFKRG